MPVSFSCPQCRAVIRSPKPLPAGQRVKCPKCAKVFAVTGGDGASESVTARPPAPVASAPSPAFDSPTPRRRPPASSMAMINMCIIGLFLLIGGVGIAAAIFWGNTRDRHDVAIVDSKSGGSHHAETTEPSSAPRDTAPRATTPKSTQPDKIDNPPPPPPQDTSVNKGTGNEDPLAFVPADASIIVGLDLGSLLKLRPELVPLAPALLAGGDSAVLKALADPKKDIGLEFTDLVDQILVSAQVEWAKQGATPGLPDDRTIIIKSKVPFDQRKVAASLSKAAHKRIKDKATYEISDPLVSTLYMPSDRIIILTTLDGEKLDALLVTDGSKPVLPPDALSLAQDGRKGTLWAVLPFDDTIKQALAVTQVPEVMAKVPPELQPAVKLVPQAKAAALWLTLDQSNLKASIGITCGNDANAKTVATTLLNAWNTKYKGMYNQLTAPLVKDLPPDVQTLMKNVGDTTIAVPRQATAEVSVQFSVKAIDGLIKEAQDPKSNLMAMLGQLGTKAFEKPFQITPEEKQLLDLVNKERKDAELPELKPNPKLFEVARAHAALMAKTNQALDEIDEVDNVKRLAAAGIAYEKTEVNIALFAPPQAVGKWKGTAAEKERMLGEKFTETGIGVAKDGKGQVYTTQIYIQPK